MKRIEIFFGLLFIFSTEVYSQVPGWQWAKTLGGGAGNDVGLSITTDATGNVFATGYFVGPADFDPGIGTCYLNSLGYDDIFISKSDSLGNFIWAKAMGGIFLDYGFSIKVDVLGNVYVTGTFHGTVDFNPDSLQVYNLISAGSADIFILKLDASGNFVWARRIGGGIDYDHGYSIALDTLCNVYTTGIFSTTVDFDPGAGVFNLTGVSHDVFISKLDSAGHFLWAKRLGGGNPENCMSIAVDAFSNVYTAGFFMSSGDYDPGPAIFPLYPTTSSGINTFISKLDSSGNFVWAKAFDGTVSQNGKVSVAASDSAVYLSGYFSGTTDFNPAGIYNLTSAGATDAFIAKYSANGNFVWAKRMGGPLDDGCFSIALDSFGSENVYATGSFSGTADFDPGIGIFNLTSAGDRDIFITKLDSSGSFIWAQSVGGINLDQCNSIALRASGGVYVTGAFYSATISFGSSTLTNSGNGFTDAFIAYLDTSGITGIERIDVNGIIFYPNPMINQLTVHPSPLCGINKIQIYNIPGEKLFEKTYVKNTVEEKIDVSQLVAGMYFVKMFTENGAMTFKVVKE